MTTDHTHIRWIDMSRAARCCLAALDHDIERLNAVMAEADRDATVGLLIAALAAGCAGNAIYFRGEDGARTLFGNTILNAQVSDPDGPAWTPAIVQRVGQPDETGLIE